MIALMWTKPINSRREIAAINNIINNQELRASHHNNKLVGDFDMLPTITLLNLQIHDILDDIFAAFGKFWKLFEEL